MGSGSNSTTRGDRGSAAALSAAVSRVSGGKSTGQSAPRGGLAAKAPGVRAAPRLIDATKPLITAPRASAKFSGQHETRFNLGQALSGLASATQTRGMTSSEAPGPLGNFLAHPATHLAGGLLGSIAGGILWDAAVAGAPATDGLSLLLGLVGRHYAAKAGKNFVQGITSAAQERKAKFGPS